MIINDVLKERILEVAIKGNLIKNDESLKRCNVKAIDYKPFDIPNNWVWSKIDYISTYKNGFAFNSSMMNNEDGIGYPVIKSANIGKKEVIINSKTDYVAKPNEKMLDCIINKNDILMVLSSQSSNVEPLGVSAIYKLDTPALLNQRVLKIVCNDNVDPNYILFAINSKWFHTKLSNKAAGLAQANLKLDHVLSMEIPIPPLEEQKRIVDRIEELYCLIDKKEKNDNEKNKLKHILKEKILDSAIHGTLVDNDLSVKPISSKYAIHEEPFVLPSNWIWSNFDKMAIKISDGTHSTPKYIDEGVPFLSVKDMSDGILHFDNCKYISKEEHDTLYKRCDPKRNDLLITKVGTTGVPVIVDTDEEFSIFVSVAQLRFNLEELDLKFIRYVVLSKFVQDIISENTRGAVNKNWVIKDIKKTTIPLPPLEEQKRIVEKIESLFELIEQL